MGIYTRHIFRIFVSRKGGKELVHLSGNIVSTINQKKIMSVKYSIAARKNPRNPEAPKKYYAQAQADGTLEFGTMCDTIADRGTCIKGDVMAALDGVIHTMKQALAEGQIVRLGELGSFQIVLGSYPAVSAKDFISTLIRKQKILFRPGKALTDLLKTLSYKQVNALPVKEKVEE